MAIINGFYYGRLSKNVKILKTSVSIMYWLIKHVNCMYKIVYWELPVSTQFSFKLHFILYIQIKYSTFCAWKKLKQNLFSYRTK